MLDTQGPEYIQAIQAYQALLESNYALRFELKHAQTQISNLECQLSTKNHLMDLQNQSLAQQATKILALKQTAQALAAQIEERNLMIARLQYENRLELRF